eukprot:CAMPEP_0204152762 /NCGR_PEP_ID=MMETSP0361-20130328/27295_1 /ASSEMBLY_ACC=CAM_ASM_000343 /TAXON_ID=268821 /ORGANISM="Scrippsiella Hangoei, Strain SHTV-5" /LENGTH=580 /DNA_ID=CAMNT_0051107781 /DNA_START=33 /DNA_END=1773 /DNA_ORIENTATION=-
MDARGVGGLPAGSDVAQTEVPLAMSARAAAVGVGGAAPAEGDDDVFSASHMLQAATGAGAAFSRDEAAARREDMQKITDACVGKSATEAWRKGFQDAVTLMLQKTRRSMQHGLAGVADSVVVLVDGAAKDCGQLSAFGRFKGQAQRLHVLATSKSLARLNSKVTYEPLKSLTVGDIDIHKELNALLVAWQLNKGAEAVGLSLAALLKMFAEDADVAPEITQVAPSPPTPGAKSDERATVRYWTEALNEAFKRLGDSSRPAGEGCIGEELAQRQQQLVSAAFDLMMQKTRRGMQQGMRSISSDILTLLDELGAKCEPILKSSGAKRLRSAADRLKVLSSSKSLLNPGGNVDYDPMKVLKIGGVDVHLELNRFIGAWISDRGAAAFGDGLANFFEDFREEDEAADEPADTAAAAAAAGAEQGHPLWRMVRDSMAGANFGQHPDLAVTCFLPDATATFATEMNGAIEHMLQKRKKTMQTGLKELADATDKLWRSQLAACVASPGAQAIWTGAKKLRKVTRRTVVDYGKHINYEAMKSLTVGGVPIHLQLNNFLAAWKLRSQEEAGNPFGELMETLSRVPGYDE